MGTNRGSWGLIGFGKVGRVLAEAFGRAGWRLDWVVDPHLPPELPEALSAVPAYPILSQADTDVELVFICVPDAQIAGVVDEICQSEMKAKFHFVAHTCGSIGAGILAGLKEFGVEPLAWHPLQSFTGGEGQYSLSGVTIGMDGSESALEFGRKLAEDVGGRPLIVPAEMRALYHLSGVFSSNLTVALAGMAAGFLQEIGMDSRESYAALEPIMLATVRNIAKQGVPDAISGPLVRDDRVTVRRHLDTLQSRPEALAIYRKLSRVLLDYLGKNDVI